MRRINPKLYEIYNFFRSTLENLKNYVLYMSQRTTQKRIHFSKEDGLWFITHENRKWFFARVQRAHCYKQGLERILDKVWDSYGLTNVSLPRNKVYVIDVGSNVGEFGYFIQRNYRESEIICIDAEASELKCAFLNLRKYCEDPDCHKTTFVNALLWKTNELIEFFNLPETADSSAIKPLEGAPSTYMPTTTLDRIYEGLGSPFAIIDILKLDVEGAEPEVFLGAENLLKKVRFIATDLGPERGLFQEETLSQVNAFLYQHDFELVFASSKNRKTYVYRNTLF